MHFQNSCGFVVREYHYRIIALVSVAYSAYGLAEFAFTAIKPINSSINCRHKPLFYMLPWLMFLLSFPLTHFLDLIFLIIISSSSVEVHSFLWNDVTNILLSPSIHPFIDPSFATSNNNLLQLLHNSSFPVKFSSFQKTSVVTMHYSESWYNPMWRTDVFHVPLVTNQWVSSAAQWLYNR